MAAVGPPSAFHLRAVLQTIARSRRWGPISRPPRFQLYLILTLALAVLVLGEKLTPLRIFGIVLIILGRR